MNRGVSFAPLHVRGRKGDRRGSLGRDEGGVFLEGRGPRSRGTSNVPNTTGEARMGGLPLELRIEAPGNAPQRVQLRERAHERLCVPAQRNRAKIAGRLVTLPVPGSPRGEAE